MKKRIRADLLRADFETSPLAAQMMAIKAAQAQQDAIRQAVYRAAVAFGGVEPVRVEVTFEGVTVSVEISPQALQTPGLLTNRIETALDLAGKGVKRKAKIKRGTRKKEKSSIENEQWFWKTFTDAARKAMFDTPATKRPKRRYSGGFSVLADSVVHPRRDCPSPCS